MLTSPAIPRVRVLAVVPTRTHIAEVGVVEVMVDEVAEPGAAISLATPMTLCISPDRWAVEGETQLWH